MKALAAALLCSLVVGCGTTQPRPSSSSSSTGVSFPSTEPPPSLPADFANRSALPACGQESTTQLGGFNVEARTCFWNAYLHGQPAEFISTEPTTEGDPITSYYRVLAAGRAEVFIDSTQDRFGSGTWTKLDCRTLEPVNGPVVPDFGPGDCTETTIHSPLPSQARPSVTSMQRRSRPPQIV